VVVSWIDYIWYDFIYLVSNIFNLTIFTFHHAQAFDQMTGTQFLDDRRADMQRTFTRHAVLSDNLVTLQNATAMERLMMPQRITDAETIARTWDNFAPAVPLTASGAVAAGAGFLGGWGVIAALLSLLGWPLRRWFARGRVAA